MSKLTIEHNQLVPTSAAQFPGSFASDFRKDHRIYPESRDWRSVLYAFFLEGWKDVSIWKSAVGIIPLLVADNKLLCSLDLHVHF
jgi:hypothetical protein